MFASTSASILDGQNDEAINVTELLEMANADGDNDELALTTAKTLIDLLASSGMVSPAPDEIELQDMQLLRMLEQPLSPLTVLSISAIITTISLFFCGIPICMQIYRRRSTHEISGFPFLMGFLGGAFWLRYGLLKSDLTMVSVNVVGVTLMLLYLLFYLYYSRPRTNFLLQLMMIKSLVAIMLVLVNIYGMDSIKLLGFVCMTFNIVNFGAPLAGMAVVLRNRSCATLPLPLCTANLLVSSQWCIYGVCVQDIFIIIPNACGVVLASFQISLFLIFPRSEGTHAPLAKCCPRLLDLEKGDGGLIGGDSARGRKAQKKEHQYAHHRTLNPRNKFLHRQRVIDRRLIPASRAACIEYLRAGGAFDASFGSVSSRATQDSWMSGNGGGGNSTRISSSLSHPELFAAVQQASDFADQPCLYLRMDGNGFDTSGEQLPPKFGQPSTISVGPSTSLLSTTIGPTPSFTSTGGAGLSVSRPAVGLDFGGGGIPEESMLDENQLLTEERPAEGDLLFIRTLSAPDLMALLRGGGGGNPLGKS